MKKILLAMLLFSAPMLAQRPALTSPVIRFSDSNGKPLAFGTLQSYAAGTTTPLSTFVDSTTGAVNANPVVLDSTGSATVFLGANVYKLVLKNAAGVVQWTADNIAEGAFQSSYVKSFSGRTGIVVPATGDYTCAQVTGCPTLPTPPTLYNQTIQVSGSSEPQEVKLNFIPGISGSVGNPTVTAGGSGYSGAPSVVFTGGSCVVEPTGSTAVSGGAVTALVLVSNGSGCTSAPAAAFSGGGGTGAAATVTVIPDGITCIDNPGAGSTDCMFTFGSGGGGAAIAVADVTSSRSFTTVFTNTTTSAMYVSGWANTASGGSVGGIQCNIGPTTGLGEKVWSQVQTATNVPGDIGFTCMVPASYSYQIVTAGAVGTLAKWFEYTGFGGGGGGSGSGCTPTGATNSLQKNDGAGGCSPSSAIDNGSTFAIAEPTTAPAVNTVINAGSSLSTAVTACGATNTTIQITQTIAVGTGIVDPPNCTLLFESGGNLTGTSITINGPIQAARRQIIGAGLAVTLGPLTTEVPIEWFGGKADATGSVGVGTDNLAPFNLANNALSAGCITFVAGGYRFSSTPTFAKTNMCISGVTLGYPNNALGFPANSSNLFIDSASANGPRFTSTALYGEIHHVAVLRTQTPTGTAKGISVEAVGVKVHDLASQDSVYNVYYVNAGSAGQGITENVVTGWGNTGFAGTPGVPVCGFYVDSAGGAVNASIRFLNDSSSSNLGGAGTTTGLCAVGTNISDMSINHFESAQTNFGIDLENTGTSGFVAQDIQINDSILNGCITVCLKVVGAGSTLDGLPHVSVHGGNFFPEGTGAIGVLVQNSTNIEVSGVQIGHGGTNITDISLSSVDGFTIAHNTIDGIDFGTGVGISILNSTHGTISNNQIKLYMTGTGIKSVGSTLVSMQGNSIAANTGGTLTTGISFDSGSSNNGPWSLNNIDAATVTTPVSDAGTGNNTLSPSILALAGGSAMNANQGNGAKVQHSTGSTTTNNCGKFDANGNIVDAGAACGSGGGVSITAGTAALTVSPSPLTGTGTIDLNLAHANTWTAKQTMPASASGGAGFNLPHGAGPSSPINGDFWTTISGLFGQINGATNNFLMSSTGLSASKLPKSNGGGSTSDSLYTDNGTFGTYGGTGGFSSPSLNSLAINLCPDTSGSGTAQTCVTTAATPFTPVAGSCVTYTTTTTNSGAGLTLNVNSLGVKSVAIPGASGWTTTLTAGIILANKPLHACYDGTNWDIAATGTVAAAPVTSVFGRTGGVVATSGDYTAAQVTGAAVHVANGTSALGTGAISSATCATVVTTTATGTATTDVVGWGFNGDPTAVTGYVPLTTGMLTIIAYPSSGNVNFRVCNNTSASITPGAITLNWSVLR